jgi:hypothetical protein
MKPIFSTRIDDQNPVHTRVTVFNRGGNAGTLTVNTSDAAELIARIEGRVSTVNQQADIVTGTMVGAVIESL